MHCVVVNSGDVMWVCGELENIIIFLSEVYIGCTNLVMVYNVFVFNETTNYVCLSQQWRDSEDFTGVQCTLVLRLQYYHHTGCGCTG